jgi:hypothetical protein
MADDLPSELSAILSEPDTEAREFAWERFVAKHSRLLLGYVLKSCISAVSRVAP